MLSPMGLIVLFAVVNTMTSEFEGLRPDFTLVGVNNDRMGIYDATGWRVPWDIHHWSGLRIGMDIAMHPCGNRP
jgi:hypothetical protein